VRYAIISDIHSNLHAFKQALEEIEVAKVDKIICLGDVVGYNALPSECIKLLQEHPKVKKVFGGNHDSDVCRFDTLRSGEIMEMSVDAYKGAEYSSSNISDAEKEWLGGLPVQEVIEDPHMPFWCSHYSPNKCTVYGYILNKSSGMEASSTLKLLGKANLFFFGHTHLPTYIKRAYESFGEFHFDMGRHLENDTYVIDGKFCYLINPGAIGQPRNGGITSFAILDTEERTVKIQGFEYNIKPAQQAIEEAGYSNRIAKRLDSSEDEEVLAKAKKAAKKKRCKERQKAKDALKSSKVTKK